MPDSSIQPKRFPSWIRAKIRTGENRKFVSDMVDNLELNTVCQSAKCPNINECWHDKAATVMILGDRCTRKCAFCAISSFNPNPPDVDEPERVAKASKMSGLQFIVLTSVDRDDLPDKGANHWVRTVEQVYKEIPDVGMEILTPDFKGREEHIAKVAAAGPLVFNHNMETCERLTKDIRSGNRYDRSLSVLSMAKKHGPSYMLTKSGIMVGLGETDQEVETTLKDMYNAGIDILTIGQYLRPSTEHWPVHRYVEPEQFQAWEDLAYQIGFKAVASGPMVRSSYKAEALARKALNYEIGSWLDFRSNHS